jgi:hypothetical protein
MAILTEKPAEWASYSRNLPAGYRAITDTEAKADKAILQAARTFIDSNVRAGKPIGTTQYVTVNGNDLLFTIEPHYHEPGGPTKPWGWHKGCSVSIKPKLAYVPNIDASQFIGDPMALTPTTHNHVRTGAMVALPILGAVLLGPVGIALGVAGTLGVKHFVKPA